MAQLYPLATPSEAREIEAIRTGDPAPEYRRVDAQYDRLFDMIPEGTSEHRLRGHLVAFAAQCERLASDIEEERCTSTLVIRDRLLSMVTGFKESLTFDGGFAATLAECLECHKGYDGRGLFCDDCQPVTMAESRTGKVLGWDRPSFEDTCPDCGREEAIGRDSGCCQFCPFGYNE